MTPEPPRSASRRLRTTVAAGALGFATILGGIVAASPATAVPTVSPAPTPTTTPTVKPVVGEALRIDLPTGMLLTLPAKDGLRDRATVQVRSGKPGLVDVDAIRGTKTVHLGSRLSLTATSTGWTRSVSVPVTGLTAGRWRLRASRSTDHTVLAKSATFPVGSGAPVHVLVHPAARTLYPYKDGTLDSAAVTVVAEDETNGIVPVTGTVRIDSGKQHVTRKLSAKGAATVPVTSLPLGAATITTTVRSAAGTAVRHTALTLAPTAVGTLHIARSSDTVQPVVDGLLDSVVLTTTGAASAGSTAKVSGTLTVTKGKTVAATYAVKDGTKRAFTWDGRVKGVVVPGTYTVTLSLKGPQGLVRTKTSTLLVTKAHLPYAVRDMFTVAAGNQQGLAVRNGMFYVGYSLDGDQSRIDLYDGTGTLMSSVGPLPIPHVAELAYSTSTGMLYAATGGGTTPTKIFVIDPTDPQWGMGQPTDPTAVIRATYDLSGQLGDNAMVAVDDTTTPARLLVFSGSTGNFSISSVTTSATPILDPTGSQALDADGDPESTPAGTITSTVPIAITGTPQGMDLVGQQLWVYTSLKKVNHVAKYDLGTNALLNASAASGSADLYWGGEGEGMATVAAGDTGDGLPAWIFVGAHNPIRSAPNLLGELVPVTDND